MIADLLCSSEPEADIQRNSSGQRLMDGKIEGQSVVDLKIADRRTTPRFRVQIQTILSVATTLEGSGTLRDLSRNGCRVETPVSVAPGVTLGVRIYVPNQKRPLIVEAARVQWVSGRVFGLTFSRIKDNERERLGDTITTLMDAS